jgi:methyltransferase (TIGR00027 family)
MRAEISQTATVTAYLRAFARVELYGDNRSGDWLAHHFLPADWAASLHSPEARAHVKANVMQPGMYAYLTARTAHFDEVFRRAQTDGCEQVVILGAGFDTRAQRLRSPGSDCRVFELDAPATQEHKQACMAGRADLASAGVQYAAVDLRGAALDEVLGEMGVAAKRQTLFLLEGLTMYLPCEAVTALLASIQAFAPTGSRLVLDYLLADVLAGESLRYGAAGLCEKAAEHGEPLRCGFMPEAVEAEAVALGYHVLDHLLPDALSNRYLVGLNTDLTGPISQCFANLVLGVKK